MGCCSIWWICKCSCSIFAGFHFVGFHHSWDFLTSTVLQHYYWRATTLSWSGDKLISFLLNWFIPTVISFMLTLGGVHWLFLWRKAMHCCGQLTDMTWHNPVCVSYSNPCHKGWWLPCSATLFILHHVFPTLNCLLAYWMTWFAAWPSFHH